MRLVLLVTILGALLLPAAASAGVVSTTTTSDGTTVTYDALPGETNSVNAHFQFFGNWIDVYDDSATVTTSDPNCTQVHSWQVHCILPPDTSTVDSLRYGAMFVANLGDGDDSFQPSPGTDAFRAVINGGPGVDNITLGDNQSPFPSIANGGDGTDILQSGKKVTTPNLFFGDGGDDYIFVANGAKDGATCGDGNDYVRADAGDDVNSDCETVTR